VILITVANALTDSYAGIVFEAPGNVSFNVFNSVWTILVGAFLLIVPLRFAGSKVNHHFGALALDALTAIFWFAGFIALAVWTNRWHNAGGFIVTGRIYNCAAAASVFAAIEWYVHTLPGITGHRLQQPFVSTNSKCSY
jgi:hypothetical protein